MNKKMALLAVLIILPPASIRGLWVGVAILKNSSGAGVNTAGMERQIAAAHKKKEAADPAAAGASEDDPNIKKLEYLVAREKFRRHYEKQIPFAYFLLAIGLLGFCIWCLVFYKLFMQPRIQPNAARDSGAPARRRSAK